jgi:carbon storage regulator
MLILSRTPGQDLIIGENVIVVRVLEVRGSKVKLGIQAPEGVPVNRREVYEAKMREQLAAIPVNGEREL